MRHGHPPSLQAAAFTRRSLTYLCSRRKILSRQEPAKLVSGNCIAIDGPNRKVGRCVSGTSRGGPASFVCAVDFWAHVRGAVSVSKELKARGLWPDGQPEPEQPPAPGHPRVAGWREVAPTRPLTREERAVDRLMRQRPGAPEA